MHKLGLAGYGIQLNLPQTPPVRKLQLLSNPFFRSPGASQISPGPHRQPGQLCGVYPAILPVSNRQDYRMTQVNWQWHKLIVTYRKRPCIVSLHVGVRLISRCELNQLAFGESVDQKIYVPNSYPNRQFPFGFPRDVRQRPAPENLISPVSFHDSQG